MRVSSGEDVELVSGGDVVGRVGETVDIVAGEVQVSAAGGVGVTGGDMALSSFGDVAGYATGSVSVGAESLAGSVSSGVTADVGGDVSAVVGGGIAVESGGAGSATFGDGVSVSAGSVVVESGDRLVGVGAEVDVTGSESVRVGSMGAVVELLGGDADGDTEYVGFVWRSSASFDEHESLLAEAITGVEEVIVRSAVSGGARVLSHGGTSVWMELQSAAGWSRVWSTSLGEGSYSVDGLHVQLRQAGRIGHPPGVEPVGEPVFRWVGRGCVPLRARGRCGRGACFGVERFGGGGRGVGFGCVEVSERVCGRRAGR